MTHSKNSTSVSLDSSDILGSFFQLLSNPGPSGGSSYDRPPFYLDPSTNLFQNNFGGSGGGTYSQQVT